MRRALDVLRAAERRLGFGAAAADVPARPMSPAHAPGAAWAGAQGPMPTAEPLEILDENPLEMQPIDAELVLDDEITVVEPVAAAPTPSVVPDFARDPLPVAAAFSPRRTLADMLQSFMEEKNIRWGELASGMLIVGSAIGLVISLRATLAQISEQISYFPALLFLLGTLTIHAAGLYTLRRWKLRSTSRGVLIIATLLVPLSFVAGILLSRSDADRLSVTSPVYLAAVAVGLLGYGLITSLSARALFAEGWWRLVLAVMGTSAGQLIINRQGEVEGTETSMVRATAIFALPLVSYLVATLSQLHQIARKKHLSRARSTQTFTVLGIAVFALAVSLGLLIYRTGAVRETLTVLSPSLSLAAAAVLGLGLAVHWRSESANAAETRTAGTALAVFGAMLMAGAIVLAWPSPLILIAVSLVTALAFVVLAVVGQVAVLHACRGGGSHPRLSAHRVVRERSAGRFAHGQSAADRCPAHGTHALALLMPAVAIAGLGGWLVYRRRAEVAWAYLLAAAGIVVASGAIGMYAGFWSGVDADWTTPLFAVYGGAGVLVAWLGSRLQLPVSNLSSLAAGSVAPPAARCARRSPALAPR